MVVELERAYPPKHKRRARNINYHHVIDSLIRKPQAFRHSQLRDDLLPTPAFKAIWKHVNDNMAAKLACRLIVGLLALAAKHDCERNLGDCVMADIADNQLRSLEHYKKRYGEDESVTIPDVNVNQHNLADYNNLATGEITCPA